MVDHNSPCYQAWGCLPGQWLQCNVPSSLGLNLLLDGADNMAANNAGVVSAF